MICFFRLASTAVYLVFFECRGVLAVSFGDLGSGGGDGMYWGRARMKWGDESDAGEGEVPGGWDCKSEMSMIASSLNGGDGHCISIELLFEWLEAGVSRLVGRGQWAEFGMGKLLFDGFSHGEKMGVIFLKIARCSGKVIINSFY
jgi:hypothetical protein